MNLEEARAIMELSDEEVLSIKEYLNYLHTEINILGNLDSNMSESLEKDGWLFTKKSEQLEVLINHFVNIYSAMYKSSKENSRGGIFFRGTDESVVPRKCEILKQFLSTSTDRIKAQFFGGKKPVLLTIDPDLDVPCLDAELFRDKERVSEDEVIFAPFCKAEKVEYQGKNGVYSCYRIRISKPQLPEKTDEELAELRSFVINGVSQNMEDIKQEHYVWNEQYRWTNLHGAAQNAEDRACAYSKVEELREQYNEYNRKTRTFKNKLQELLMGLCRQRELQIDEAHMVIQAEEQRKRDEYRAQVRTDIKNTYLEELTPKLEDFPAREEELKTNITTQYQRLQKIEQEYLMLSRKLELLSTGSLAYTGIEKKIEAIQSNLGIVRQELGNVQISDENSYEEVCQTYEDVNPVLDGVLYGLELSKELSGIADEFKKRTEKELKKKLFEKVHGIVKDAKVKKLLNERDDIKKEGVGWFGGFNGKNDLQVQRLENIRLKVQLIQDEQPEEKQEYSIKDMLAEIKAFAMSELGGNLTPEMEKIYGLIMQNFKEEDGRPISEDEILQLAREKVSAKQIVLPVVQEKKKNRFFGTTRSQIELLKLENAAMKAQVIQNAGRSNMPKLSVDTVLEPEPLTAFELKLKGIEASTRNSDLIRSKITDRTFDLFA